MGTDFRGSCVVIEFTSQKDGSLAQDDHPFYGVVDELLITRDLEIVGRLDCERISLPRSDNWPSHHIGGHVGRSTDGALHTVIGAGDAGMYWHSADAGVTWEGENLDTGGAGAFTVLDDDTCLIAVGGGTEPIRILHRADGTTGWEQLAQIEAGLFDALHVDRISCSCATVRFCSP